MQSLFDKRALSPGRPFRRARPGAHDAASLLDRFGGDVTLATRRCNAEMQRREQAQDDRGAHEALLLRKAVGEEWARRITAGQ